MFCYCCDASLSCAWGGVSAGFPVLFVSRSFGHMTSVARNVLCVPKTFDSFGSFFCMFILWAFTRVTRSEIHKKKH